MTLQEILDYISNNIIDNNERLITPEVLRDVESAIVQWAEDNKVAKVTGKGLSTEDFTTLLLNKLNGIKSGAEVNEVSASDLLNYILKDKGIELRDNKGNLQAQDIVSSWNDIISTGFYEGGSGNISDMPAFTDTRGAYVIHQKIGGGATTNYSTQIAMSYDGSEIAIRSKDNGVWGDWQMILSTADKTELLEKINKLTIDNIDLSDFEGWNVTAKTLDLSTKTGVGIINFDSTFSSVGITGITSAETAVVKFDDVSSVKLFQNNQLINLSGVVGGVLFDNLNSGDYTIKNIDHIDGSFELYQSDGTAPVDTSRINHAGVTNVTIQTEAIFTVGDASELSNGMLVELDGLGGMESLEGTIYQIAELSSNEFKLAIYEMDGNYVDTTGMTYSGGGNVISAGYVSGGNIQFKDGVIDVEIFGITGLDNGSKVRYTANENNTIDFRKTQISIATSGDIVGTGSLVLNEDNIAKSIINKNLNWMKLEFEAD